MKKVSKSAKKKVVPKKEQVVPPDKQSDEVLSLPDLDGLPPETREVVMSFVKHHSGPLPPPEQLEACGAIIPGGAERIMIMAEKQSAHRIEMEREMGMSEVQL